MNTRPDFLTHGERSMLFPVMAETSKEGRAVSIFLSCLEHVAEFGKLLLGEIGVKAHSRTTVETWTEVNLKKTGAKAFRPDGLVHVRNGDMKWSALIEAKIGTAELTAEQVETYLELAKINGIDALITISNQFAPYPSHYPILLTPTSAKKASLWHWSWVDLLTKAEILLAKELVQGPEKQVLSQFARFLDNSASGVQGYDLMPQAWSDLVSMVQSRSPLTPRSVEVQDVVSAWHQKTQDLCARMSRRFKEKVAVKLPRVHAQDPFERTRQDLSTLVNTHCVSTDFAIPGAASPLSITADFGKRALYFSMELAAPEDRKSTKARINWLLRQLEGSKPENVHVRLSWPGKAPITQYSLDMLRKAPEVAEQENRSVTRFEVTFVQDLGARFTKRKIFNAELDAVFVFYDEIGRHLKEWQPPKPKADKATNAETALGTDTEPVADTKDCEFTVLGSSDHASFIGDHHTNEQRAALEAISSAIIRGVLPAPTRSADTRRLNEFRLPELLYAQSAFLNAGPLAAG